MSHDIHIANREHLSVSLLFVNSITIHIGIRVPCHNRLSCQTIDCRYVPFFNIAIRSYKLFFELYAESLIFGLLWQQSIDHKSLHWNCFAASLKVIQFGAGYFLWVFFIGRALKKKLVKYRYDYYRYMRATLNVRACVEYVDLLRFIFWRLCLHIAHNTAWQGCKQTKPKTIALWLEN
jgi:hypothetical protein